MLYRELIRKADQRFDAHQEKEEIDHGPERE